VCYYSPKEGKIDKDSRKKKMEVSMKKKKTEQK
jgi:hypothetical protein